MDKRLVTFRAIGGGETEGKLLSNWLKEGLTVSPLGGDLPIGGLVRVEESESKRAPARGVRKGAAGCERADPVAVQKNACSERRVGLISERSEVCSPV
jgi:hypothetical protein